MRNTMRDLKTILAAAILAATLFGVRSAFTGEFSCNDLLTANANRLIAIPTDGFSHGEPCYSDDSRPPAHCDWNATIELDRMIGDDRRIVVVNSSHLSGSGAWDYVFVFHCVSRRIRAVFQDRFLYGARVEDASADKLVLLVGDWGSKDPVCCPSREKRIVYSWHAEGQSYVIDREDSRPLAR
jgi:hypothetical protein